LFVICRLNKYSVIIMDFFTYDWILIAIIGTNSCNIDLHYFSTNTLQIQILLSTVFFQETWIAGFPRILENGKYPGVLFCMFPVGKCPWKLKKRSKSGIYCGNLYWKRNFLTTGSFDAICQFLVTSLGPIINSSLALFVPIIIKASTIGQKKKDERHRDELITWIWICNVFVEK
jgi:hypothetical protein